MIRRVDTVIEDLLYLCREMRDDEIEQYLAITNAPSYNYRAAALGMMNIPGIKFTLLDDDNLPVVAGGYEEIAPGVFQSWMVGTNAGWAKHWRSITKHTRQVMDLLIECGARRLQTNALASRSLAREWYERGLKMQFEGVMRKYTADGRDLVLYSRIAED